MTLKVISAVRNLCEPNIVEMQHPIVFTWLSVYSKFSYRDCWSGHVRYKC